MAFTAPYALRTDYVSDAPVLAADLNRRARILSAQLPGALRASSLSPGVFPLWSPDVDTPDLVEDLAAAADGALKVTVSGGSFQVAAGAANVLHESGALVYVQTNGLSTAVTADDPSFLHLMLARAVDPLAPGALDSRTGSPPELLVSDVESEPGGLLLASRVDGVLTDRRQFTAPVLLAREFLAIRQRFDALDMPVDEGSSTGPTSAQFNALKLVVEDQGERIEALEARVATLESRTDDDFPSVEDQLADEIAINRAGLAEVNPHSIERGQISVIVVGAGHGQGDTPDYSPTTGDDLEMPFDFESGSFGGGGS